MSDFKLSVIIDAVDKASDTFKSVQKSAETLKNEINSSSDSAKTSWQKMGDSIQATGKTMTSVGSSLTMGVTAPLVATGTACAKMASDFETSMAQVQTIMDTSEVSVDDMRKGILQLSSDTGISANEIAGSVYSAISAGQDTEDALDAVRTSAELAKAGFTDAGVAMDTLTTIQNAYGSSAGSLEEISDRLITTQNLGKTTVAELGSSMGKVIPTASMYGVSLDQLSSAFVTTTKNGIATAESTTYINGMLNELGKTGTTVSTIIKDKTGKSFKEFMETGGSLTEALQIIQDEADATGVSMGDMWQSQEAGKAAATISQHAEDFNTAMTSMQNSAGTLQTAFETMDSTTSATMEKTMTQLKNDAITLGTSLLTVLAPAISQVSAAVANFSTWFQNLNPQTQEMIVKIGLAVAAIGPLLMILGQLTIGFGALVSTGMLPVIAGIAAVIVAGVGLISHWDEIKAGCAALAQNVSDKWNELKTNVGNTISEIQQNASDRWNEIKTNVGDTVSNIQQDVSDKWTEMKSNMGDTLSNIKEDTSNKWNEMTSSIGNFNQTIGNNISQKWANIKSTFSQGGSTIASFSRSAFSNVSSTVSSAMGTVLRTASSGLSNVASKFQSSLSNVSSITGSMMSSVVNFFSNSFSNIRSTVRNGLDTVRNWFSSCHLSLPHISVPHFSISGSFSLSPPSVPSIGISWYAKAYQTPMIFKKRTAIGGMGFGDGGGSEVVVGMNTLMDAMSKTVQGTATTGSNLTFGDIVFHIYEQPGQDTNSLADAVQERMIYLMQREREAFS